MGKENKLHVIILGKRNKGKSSLINLLTGQKSLMKTSATPGKTRLVNYALIDERFYLCDCPGYGFESQRDYFERLMDDFHEKVIRRNRIELADTLLIAINARAIRNIADEGEHLYRSFSDLVLYATGAAACSTADLLMVLDAINTSLVLEKAE